MISFNAILIIASLACIIIVTAIDHPCDYVSSKAQYNECMGE